uniref:Protein TSSC1 n=1 Tax=Magallana gigas TaxID=29159 RepID=K1Q757_MAGGI
MVLGRNWSHASIDSPGQGQFQLRQQKLNKSDFLLEHSLSASESKAEMKASIWRIPCDFDSSDDSSHSSLELVCHLDNADYGDMKSVLWHPTGDTTTLVGLTDSHIITWDFDASSSVAKVKDSTGLESKGQPKFTCVRWNPHHNCTQVATANDSCIRGWDLRSMQRSAVSLNLRQAESLSCRILTETAERLVERD